MTFIVAGLQGYGAVVLAVAARLVWHAATRLDAYDWRYSRQAIGFSLVLAPLFWPLLLAKPRLLVDPHPMFGDPWRRAERERERDRLAKHPPPCGATLSYAQDPAESCGTWYFDAGDVERQLRQAIGERPLLAAGDEGALFNWVARRDPTAAGTVEVPAGWGCFAQTANKLAGAGRGRVRCGRCEREFAASELTIDHNVRFAASVFDCAQCPHGHALLLVEHTHFCFAPANQR